MVDISGSYPKPESLTEELLFGVILLFVIISALGAGVSGFLSFVYSFSDFGSTEDAALLADIAAGLTMPVLAFVTSVYAYSAWDSSRQERRRQNERRREKLTELRQDIFNEIDDNLGLVDLPYFSVDTFNNVSEAGFSRTVFRDNKFRIHGFDEEVREPIISHYNVVRTLTIFSNYEPWNDDELKELLEDLKENGKEALDELRELIYP